VRQGLRLLVVIAAVPVVSGCFYFPGSFGASGSSSSSSSAAEASVRGAIPAIEAYYADNNTYSGATLQALQAYDHGVTDIRIVQADDVTYCLESVAGGETFSKAGPAAEIVAGACAGDSPPVHLPPPAENLRAAVEGMEVFRSARGTYEGVTFRDLQALVPGLKPLRVVDAGTDSFCLESTVDGQTWIARQSGDVGIGAC
jgi:hypothetical protein